MNRKLTILMIAGLLSLSNLMAWAGTPLLTNGGKSAYGHKILSNKARPSVMPPVLLSANKAGPQIVVTGTVYGQNTFYSEPSGSASFQVSGSNLQAGITVTPPAGFEVSTDDRNFSSTLTLGNATFTGPATVYIRLTGRTNAGDYEGNIVLSSNGAANVNVYMPKSNVRPADLLIQGKFAKEYGETLPPDSTFYITTPNFTWDLPGLKNGNTPKSIKFSFVGGTERKDPVGEYSGGLKLSDFEGENGFLASNYNIRYGLTEMKVTRAPLTIKADNIIKPYGTAIIDDRAATTNYTITGLKNNETVGTVRMFYGFGGPKYAAVGDYKGSITPTGAEGGTFDPGNYVITYMPGDMTVIKYPAIAINRQPDPMQTVYGTPSAFVYVRITANYLNGPVVIDAPAGFEISANNLNFTKQISLTPDANGSIYDLPISIRLTSTAPAGDHSAMLKASSAGAATENTTLIGKVTPAAITVTAKNITKPYRNTLSTDRASANFTTTGLKNNESIGTVTLSFGMGAAANTAPGTYQGSVVASGATGGTFAAANYTITYIAADLIVEDPLPELSYTGPGVSLQNTYGSVSPSVNAVVTGSYLSGNVTISSPAGFEISTDDVTFSNTVTVARNNASPITDMKVYIRLKPTTAAGDHNIDIAFASAGANDVKVPVKGTVLRAPLTITAKPVTKTYGEGLSGNTGSADLAIITGLRNNELITSVTISYTAGSDARDHAGPYAASVTPSAPTGAGFDPTNYTISYTPADLTVNKAPLTITANDHVRAFATANPVFSLSYNGFVNTDGPSVLKPRPTVSTSAVLASAPGKYTLTVSAIQADDYEVTYKAGTLTIYASSAAIKIFNTFTPNADGINDLWTISDLQYYPKCVVQVFDRYGRQIYYSRGYGQPWDGSYRGQRLPSGVYYYIIEPNDGTNALLKGSVTII